jgi:hypothetical protein
MQLLSYILQYIRICGNEIEPVNLLRIHKLSQVLDQTH